nr:CoA transferase [Akkermansiaceae bacterium]
MPGPLAGVRILDFTAMISGPMATMMLADQGADVIKVEPPTGDLARGFAAPKGMSGLFLSANRNKRSLALDLRNPESIRLIRRLLEDVDVLVQNFRPGAMERM